MKDLRRGAPPKQARFSQPDLFAAHVGARVRLRREMLNLSQQELAIGMRATVAELSEIEVGRRRTSAQDLLMLSEVLEVPLAWFYEGMPGRGQIK